MSNMSKSSFLLRSSHISCMLWISFVNSLVLKLKPIHAFRSNPVCFTAGFMLSKATRCSSLKASPDFFAADLWESYNNALIASPLITKSITAGIILGCADLTGQVVQNKASANDDMSTGTSTLSIDMQQHQQALEIDWARAGRFAFFGLVLQAPWNHFYYLMLDGALPPTEDPFTSTTVTKVLIDQFIQAPIFTVIIFGFLGILEGKKYDSIKDQLDEDYWNTMKANWKLWVPATMINIAFCPPILRVLFLNFVFFFWSIYLSLTLNKSSNNNEIEL